MPTIMEIYLKALSIGKTLPWLLLNAFYHDPLQFVISISSIQSAIIIDLLYNAIQFFPIIKLR